MFCSAKYRGGVRKDGGVNKQRQQQTEYHTPPLCFAQQNIGEVSARTEGLIKQRGLEYKQEHNPRFRLYQAAKTQGRRREKGEDCPSEACSADPDGDRSDKPKGPITAAALSLTGKESPLYHPTAQPHEQKKTAPFRKHKRIKRELKNKRK